MQKSIFNENKPVEDLKLFMLLLGSRAPGRHVEQHDFFFGVAPSLKDLVPEIKAFWREAGDKIHVDGWREVTRVDNYEIKIVLRKPDDEPATGKKLFFINLGGYQENKFEEQHYVVLTVKDDKAAASSSVKKTLFFRQNGFPGANSHIDDKYGIDVDDLYEIPEMLSRSQKEMYSIMLTPVEDGKQDALHLGYFKLSAL